MLVRSTIILTATLFSNLLIAQNVPYNLIPDWISQPNGQIATGLGLADINGDGFKDLVIANGNDISRQRVTVHYNDGKEISTSTLTGNRMISTTMATLPAGTWTMTGTSTWLFRFISARPAFPSRES